MVDKRWSMRWTKVLGERLDSEEYGELSGVGSTETKRKEKDPWPQCRITQRRAGGSLVGAIQLVLEMWNGSFS